MYKFKLYCVEFDLSLTKIRFSIEKQYRNNEIRFSTKNNRGPRTRPRPRRANTNQDEQTQPGRPPNRKTGQDTQTAQTRQDDLNKGKINKPKNQDNPPDAKTKF